MTAYWLFKQEPSTYSYSQLEKDGKTVWDGVANNLALKHLRSIRKGDKAIFYHTGLERQAVGLMDIVSEPYSDPKQKHASKPDSTTSLVVVDVKPAGRFKKPVTLEQIKGDPFFSQWELVRISRLSVMPVPSNIWDKIIELSG
jgi:predicted RNA-binding protein with PUA-like domain